MAILMKGELKGKYLLLSTESTFHSLSIMNSNSPEWGIFLHPVWVYTDQQRWEEKMQLYNEKKTLNVNLHEIMNRKRFASCSI